MGKLSCGLDIPGVYEKDGRYYKVIKNVWHPLSRIDEGVNALHRAIFELDPARPDSIGGLIKMYRAAGMDELKPATRKDYEKILLRLEHHFGKMRIGTLKPMQISVWLEKRRQAGRGSIRANREFAVLSSVHKFGMRQGWVEANPCYGVDRNTEHPKSGGTTNDDFLKLFEIAPEAIQDLIAVAYLSGVRETDIIAWTRSANLQPEGIAYVQSKTGKPHTVEWSDALRFFIRRACERCPGEDLVFLNTRGQPWTQWGINSQIRRLRVKAGVTWCFKDLRAKAQTDSPHSVLGHGAALEAVYRKALRTRPVR
jgi:site-specific recombinase XerD